MKLNELRDNAGAHMNVRFGGAHIAVEEQR